MAKSSFGAKTFAAKTFASGTWIGVGSGSGSGGGGSGVKHTFSSKTFATKTFASGTWGGGSGSAAVYGAGEACVWIVKDRPASFIVPDCHTRGAPMPVGTYPLHQIGGRRESVKIELDFGTKRHELLTGGETISGTPTMEAFLDGTLTSAITISSIVLDATSKKVQAIITDVSAEVDEVYKVVCTATLSGGNPIVESFLVPVEEP